MNLFLALKRSLSRTDDPIATAVESAALPEPPIDRPDAASEEVVLTDAFGWYVRIAALIEELFADARTPAQWQDRTVLDAVVALGRARGSLGRHPLEVAQLLGTAEEACALVR